MIKKNWLLIEMYAMLTDGLECHARARVHCSVPRMFGELMETSSQTLLGLLTCLVLAIPLCSALSLREQEQPHARWGTRTSSISFILAYYIPGMLQVVFDRIPIYRGKRYGLV